MVKFIKEGFKKFKKNYYKNNESNIVKLVKNGQKPKLMVIACSDSRVDPAILFQTKPGEIFTIRNVANLVPPYSPDEGHHGVSAAIEFGIMDLKIKQIMVLGHAHCSGITALCNNFNPDESKSAPKKEKREFINSWMNIASPIMQNIDLENNEEPLQHFVEKKSIKNSISNLKSFPWLLDLVKDKKLKIYGWWYDIENGKIFRYDENKDIFININIEN